MNHSTTIPTTRLRPAQRRVTAISLLLACACGGVWAQAGESRLDWRDALDDISWGARVQVDAAHMDGAYTDRGASASGMYLRRAEIGLGWRGPKGWRVDLTVESDGDGGAALSEAALGWRRDALHVRLGRFDPDFGLDPSTSSSWGVAMERSAIFDLAPDVASGSESLGLRVDHAGSAHSASVGMYAGDERDQIVARAVGFGRLGSGLWQAGTSLARGSGLADDGRIRSRLGLRATTELDAGRRSTLARALAGADRYRSDFAWALEGAWQQGPWIIQAEWLQRRLDGAAAASRTATGQTVLLAWAFDGAPRRHEPRRGRFGRPEGATGRWGGHWEAFIRIDRLAVREARDAEVLTLGLAWTAQENWRAAINWALARSDHANDVGQTRGRGLTMRVQAVF